MSIQQYQFKGSIDGRVQSADGETWWCRASDVEKLEKELAELRELLSLCDPRKRVGIRAPEDVDVLRMCERHGFGAVMDSAARQWYERDPIGAITLGPCAGSIQRALGGGHGL